MGSQGLAPNAWGQSQTAQKHGLIRLVPETSADDKETDAFSDDELLLHTEGFDSDERSCSSHETLKRHRMLEGFFETLDKLTLEEINDSARKWHCPACHGGPGAIESYRGLHPLATHARSKASERVGLHRVFAELLKEELQRRGTSLVPAEESFGHWEGLKKETKDHKIVWPPMVLIMNTVLQKGDDGKWLGMGNQELLQYFSSYSAVRAQHSYGNRGIGMLIFENSAVGYLEAERLHDHLLMQGTGRQEWEQQRTLLTRGGRQQLYGCLATKDDLELFNKHYLGKQRLKYEMRSYQEEVVSQLRKASEDNQHLAWLKQKLAGEQRYSKTLEQSLKYMAEKLKKTSDENQIVKQRSKRHHEENQEEMDFQDRLLGEQMRRIHDTFEDSLHFVSGHTNSSECVLKREELEKIREDKKRALKTAYTNEMLALEKEFDVALTRLMDKYTPPAFFTQGALLP